MNNFKLEFLKMPSIRKLILVSAIVTAITFTISCNKDDAPAPDSRLTLPAILENNTILNIPDATGECATGVNPGMIENTIVIDKDGIINDASKVSIELDLSHDFGGDFVVELIAPSGASCALIKRIGSSSDNDCDHGGNKFIVGNKLIFNSTYTNTVVADPVAAGNYAPLTGLSTFPSTVPVISLNSFLTGKDIKGIWKIKVYDYGVLDVGKLNAWKMKFDIGALK